jgi:predicted nucleic acid-binding protein
VRYLLDSTALIEFSRGIEPAQSRILSLIEAGHTVGVCGVTVAEFYSGSPYGSAPKVDRLIDRLPCWDVSLEVGRLAGAYRYTFLQQHRKLPTADTLIAAVARHQQATLLTNNVRDFPMTDIAVERLGVGAA